MRPKQLQLSGLLLIEPTIFADERGYFLEIYRQSAYGLKETFVQDSLSFSKKNTTRALHYQSEPGQSKLVTCLEGEIWDVAVDIRSASPTFGKWEAVVLDGKKKEQLYLPIGFAHGFCVLSETALVQYKVSSNYNPKTECTIRWNDPDIGISWPVQDPILSPRDQTSPFFKEVFREVLGHR